MADVFLSYNREDQEIARGVAADLEGEGFSVFFDVRIDVGDSWDERIERELNAAKACVVLWSARSRESQWVRREAREAMARRILCPAMIARCKVPLEFSDVQAADLIGRRVGDRAHAEWRRLCERVGNCVDRKARGVQAPAAPPSPGSAKAPPTASVLPKLPPLPQLRPPNANLASAAEGATSGSRRALVIGGAAVLGATAIAGGYYGWTRVRADGVQRAWEEARAAGTRRAVNAFLREHPNSSQATEAQALLHRLPLQLREVAALPHRANLYDATFSPDGRLVATAFGVSENGCRIWDAATGAQLQHMRHTENVYSADFTPDGSRVISEVFSGRSGTFTSNLLVWDRASGQTAALLGPLRSSVDGLAISPDGEQVATCGEDGVSIWQVPTRQRRVLSRISTHEVSFQSNGARVVSAGVDGIARVWSAATGEQLVALEGHDGPLYDACFGASGDRIVTAAMDRTARIWDTHSGAERTVLRGHGDGLTHAAFSPDGTHIVTASFDGTACVWNALTGNQVAVLRNETGVHSAEFSADGVRIITTALDGPARIWHAASGTEIASLPDARKALFSPAPSQILAACRDDTARIWEIAEEA